MQLTFSMNKQWSLEVVSRGCCAVNTSLLILLFWYKKDHLIIQHVISIPMSLGR